LAAARADDSNTREATVKATAVAFAGQPDASAVAGIQALMPIEAPASAPAFQENRSDALEFIPFNLGLLKPRRMIKR
jgi:hypothetical protein